MSSKEELNENEVRANPSKYFFIHMLTRDIDLQDAILDLVDNCIDGVVRQEKNKKNVDFPYTGHYIQLTLNDKEFRIKDNCGGIDLNTAREYAFKLGREIDDDRDLDVDTIGMYGIGMKRAIFKMGQSSTVKSYKDIPFQVTISHDWMESDQWTLPLKKDIKDIEINTTDITITHLIKGVDNNFSNQDFINKLYLNISKHYSRFIEKGLKIYLNDNTKSVPASPIRIHSSVNPLEQKMVIKPYIQKFTYNDVDVKIIVGYNAPPLEESETESKEFTDDRSEDEAGWTIFCNDRAVVFNNKTALTGWGDGHAKYHAQYVTISGVVEFNASNSANLPVTTTKRGVDSSSDIYVETKQRMMKAMNAYIKHSNSWKNSPRIEQKDFFENTKKLQVSDILKNIENITGKTMLGNIEYSPNLPKKEKVKKETTRIGFDRKIGEIKKVALFLFGTEKVSAKDVGDKSFQYVLDEAGDE
jgi:hypothetical protein